MAVWSVVDSGGLELSARFDAEYYRPDLLAFEEMLSNNAPRVEPLGNLIASGNRVVYVNTHIVDAPVNEADYVRFLQAADVSSRLPTLRYSGLGWVKRDDWERYPKGRIRRGEVLIEVKGKAEKVALVPSGFPKETLVSGSLYKLSLREGTVEPEYLVAYLLSAFGRGFRHRSLTNTLIGFVNAAELHAIPVPILSPEDRKPIVQRLRDSLQADAESNRLLVESESAAELSGIDLGEIADPSLTYEVSSQRVFPAGRLDAEYFQPCKWNILEKGRALERPTVSDFFSLKRDTFNPSSMAPSSLVRNFDLNDALQPFLDDSKAPTICSEVRSVKMKLRHGDLVVSRLRSYLREIAIVLCSKTPPPVASTEFIVLRRTEDGLSAETLLAYLRAGHAQTVLQWSQDGSNHPRFNAAALLALPVPQALLDQNETISQLVRKATASRQQAVAALNEACQLVERSLGLPPS